MFLFPCLRQPWSKHISLAILISLLLFQGLFSFCGFPQAACLTFPCVLPSKGPTGSIRSVSGVIALCHAEEIQLFQQITKDVGCFHSNNTASIPN